MMSRFFNFLTGLILGLSLAVNISYGYRITKPQRITDFDQNALVTINENLERIWDITNGRMTFDVVSAVPSGSAEEGTIKLYSSGGVYRIYIYLNSGWRVWSSD